MSGSVPVPCALEQVEEKKNTIIANRDDCKITTTEPDSKFQYLSSGLGNVALGAYAIYAPKPFAFGRREYSLDDLKKMSIQELDDLRISVASYESSARLDFDVIKIFTFYNLITGIILEKRLASLTPVAVL